MNQLYVVGMGPGQKNRMTLEAQEVLRECQVIAGYTVYTELLKEIFSTEKSLAEDSSIEKSLAEDFSKKEYIETPMRKEKERCILALEAAAAGKTTAMVCSGDAGVYGMAGLILELAEDYPQVEVTVVAGVSAALSGAAVLGAPLGHDFAVISLSDLLTPWELIERRLSLAARADMAICLYNPSSKKRHDYLEKACEILLGEQKKETVCGYVRNIGREGQEYCILSLEELKTAEVDMFTTVFVGNSTTQKIGDRMVTPRGYKC